MLNELDKREVKLIKEVSDKTGYSVEEIYHAFNKVKQTLILISEEIKRTIESIYNYFKLKYNQECQQKWHVPINIKIPEMPFVKNHNLQFARNNI